jgi:hypothetical protein
MSLSPNVVRGRNNAVSTAWVAVPDPGSARSRSRRETTTPGRCASARIVAMLAGDSYLTTPSNQDAGAADLKQVTRDPQGSGLQQR